jgi:two-component system, OmpR family, response regulator
MKVLVIEDDRTTADYLCKGLGEHGFVTDKSGDGQDGLFMALSNSYQLIILDRMLPGMDGMTVLKTLRAGGCRTPVLILSALDSVDERVKGLRQGGDDYLTKPFAFAELLARAELLIRRGDTPRAEETILSVDDLKMDLLAHKVTRGKREIELQPKEFQLLRFLMAHKGQVVSRTLLFETVWDYHFDPKTNVIDVHIAKLRKKIEARGETQLIHTVRGAGYVIRH